MISRMLRSVGLVAVVAAAAACASSGSTRQRPSGDQNTITAEQLAEARQSNLYDFLAAERPFWLRARGPTAVEASRVGTVVVYLNQQRFGGPESLRQFPLVGVKMIRFYDAASAQSRFGPGHVHGAIQVVTQ